jgi:hypothetical protein
VDTIPVSGRFGLHGVPQDTASSGGGVQMARTEQTRLTVLL